VFLVPDWVEGVSDDAGAEDFFLPKEMTTNGFMSQPVRVTTRNN